MKIEEYDVLYTNISRRVIAYDLHNYFESVEANITMIGDSSNNRLLNITANENIMVFSEFNYSNDSYRDLSIIVSSNQSVDTYTERFNIRGATIENYIRIPKNYSISIFMFDIKNNWYAGYVNWSISDPNINNRSYLENNESVLVFIEYNYTIQGNKQPKINATIKNYIDYINDYFEIRPVKINNVITLTEAKNFTVTELTLENNLDINQLISFRFDSGIINISNSTILNASQTILVYLASNYSTSNIYRTIAYANSSGYNDTGYGVVII